MYNLPYLLIREPNMYIIVFLGETSAFFTNGSNRQFYIIYARV